MSYRDNNYRAQSECLSRTEKYTNINIKLLSSVVSHLCLRSCKGPAAKKKPVPNFIHSSNTMSAATNACTLIVRKCGLKSIIIRLSVYIKPDGWLTSMFCHNSERI